MDLLTLKESVKKYEGLSLKPYVCPKKKLTIGYGRNLDDMGITLREADIMLENDLLHLKLELEDRVPVFKLLDNVRRNVLLEMAYNMGVPNLLEFKNTLKYLNEAVKKVDADHLFFHKASVEMLDSQWHRDFVKYDAIDGKKNNNGLLRSEYLSKMMKEGKYV